MTTLVFVRGASRRAIAMTERICGERLNDRSDSIGLPGLTNWAGCCAKLKKGQKPIAAISIFEKEPNVH
jgi:hypothetical protein